MNPGDIVRIHMPWAIDFHGKLALVTELPAYGTVKVILGDLGLKEFDKEVLEVTDESR
jgi:hypothetical protein